MHWISIEEKLPVKGTKVLVWTASGHSIAAYEGDLEWQGGERPSHWMALPFPPGVSEGDSSREIKGAVVHGRIALDIDDQKENVALLMQHYIDGRPAIVNGEEYFVMDMKNEKAGEKLASVFYLKRVE